jgi:hypothetical protein
VFSFLNQELSYPIKRQEIRVIRALRCAMLLSFLLALITCPLVGVENSAKGHVKQFSLFDFGVDGFCMHT